MTPPEPCVCGHSRYVHNIGTRAGRKVRTACSTWRCGCTAYRGAEA